MRPRRYRMPNARQPVADDQGAINAAWHQYLGGIQEMSERVAAAQADSVATDVASLRAEFNAVLAKLRAANLMKE